MASNNNNFLDLQNTIIKRVVGIFYAFENSKCGEIFVYRSFTFTEDYEHGS